MPNVNFSPEELNSLPWIVPPEKSGQIVEESYADGGDLGAFKKIHDRGDNTVAVYWTSWNNLWSGVPEDQDIAFEPWNSAPNIPEDAWTLVYEGHARGLSGRRANVCATPSKTRRGNLMTHEELDPRLQATRDHLPKQMAVTDRLTRRMRSDLWAPGDDAALDPEELRDYAILFQDMYREKRYQYIPEQGNHQNLTPADFMVVFGPMVGLTVDEQDCLWCFMVTTKQMPSNEYQRWQDLQSYSPATRSDMIPLHKATVYKTAFGPRHPEFWKPIAAQYDAQVYELPNGNILLVGKTDRETFRLSVLIPNDSRGSAQFILQVQKSVGDPKQEVARQRLSVTDVWDQELCKQVVTQMLANIGVGLRESQPEPKHGAVVPGNVLEKLIDKMEKAVITEYENWSWGSSNKLERVDDMSIETLADLRAALRRLISNLEHYAI